MVERLTNSSNEKTSAAKYAMQSALREVPEGIGVGDLYQALEEQGFSENLIRSAFLELAQINVVDLTRDRKVVLVPELSTA